MVRFNAARLLGGSWEPYPIDMEFGPPCMVLSTIGEPAAVCRALISRVGPDWHDVWAALHGVESTIGE